MTHGKPTDADLAKFLRDITPAKPAANCVQSGARRVTWGSRRKFRMGDRIQNLAHLEVLLNQRRWVYLRGVPKHPSVILNMTIQTIQLFINGSGLHEAVRNEGGPHE